MKTKVHAPRTRYSRKRRSQNGPAAGLALIEIINKEGTLDDYQWLHSAKADLYRRLGRAMEARAAYEKALSLTQLEPERRFLKERLNEVSNFGVTNRLVDAGRNQIKEK